MPGKRRDYDGQFAVLEIGFVLDDPRIKSLTAGAFRYYLTLWCIAVKERREQLPHWWDTAAAARAGSLDTRTAQVAHEKLLQKCLIGKSADGRIIVYGVKSKHPNLKWKNGGKRPDLHPQISPIETEEETETETQTEEKKKTAAPPRRADQDRITEVLLPKMKKQPTTDGHWEDFHKLAGRFKKLGREVGFNPRQLIELANGARDLQGWHAWLTSVVGNIDMWRNKGLEGFGEFEEKVKPAMDSIKDIFQRATAEKEI